MEAFYVFGSQCFHLLRALRRIDQILTWVDQRRIWPGGSLETVQTTNWRSMMNSFEIVSYLTAAILGSAVAGYFGGLIAILAVFGGLGIVGFSEMLVVLRNQDA